MGRRSKVRRLPTLVQPVEPGQRPGQTLGQRSDDAMVSPKNQKEREVKHLRNRRRDTGAKGYRPSICVMVASLGLVAATVAALKLLGR